MRLIMVLLLCLLTITTACSKENEAKNESGTILQEEGFMVGYDANYMFQFDCNGAAIVKAENGYYVSINSVLYYADEELNLTPLCNKPNCLHRFEELDSKGMISCKAYTGKTIAKPGLQYYDGKIYSASKYNLVAKERFKNASGVYDGLYAFASDASSKKLIEGYESNWIDFVVHRGYIYYSFKATVQVDESNEKKPVSASYLVRMSVDTGEIETLKEFTDCDVDEIYGYRNYMYFRTDKAIYIYDISKDEFVNSFEEKRPSFWFMGDKLIYYYYVDKDSKVYTSNLDGTGEEYAFTKRNNVDWCIGTDDRYIYEDNRSTMEVLADDGDRIINYYDKNTYEYLGTINLGKATHHRHGYGDEKYFFYYGVNYDGTRSLMYFDKDELASSSVTLKELVNLGGGPY